MKDASQVQEVQFEPCFQRKKRLDGPTTTLSSDFNNFNNANIEYILLGKNAKFEDNIKYKCRPMRPFDNTQVNDKESNLSTKSLQEKPKEPATDEYVLLGNNSKFANNIVYKLKSCPDVMAVNEENKENALADDDNNANKIKTQEEELTKLDEYVLLGNNAKFSDNVVYKPKVWREFIPNYDTEKENNPAKDTEYFPVQAKTLEPAPVIDTSKFREPPKKWKNPVAKTDDSETRIKKKKNSSAFEDGSEEDLRLPLDSLPRQANEEKSQTAFKKGNAYNGQDVFADKFVRFQSPPPAPRSPNPFNLNEDPDKKLLGLLHKAKTHIHPGVEQSEYQKNFTWKKPLPNSSTAAENKKFFQTVSIFNANTSHPDPIPKLSEYQRNFQAWTPSPTKPASPTATAGNAVAHSGQNVQMEAMQQAAISSKLGMATPYTEAYSSNQMANTDQGRESKKDRPDIGSRTSGITFDDDEDSIKQGNYIKGTDYFESVNNSTAKTKPSKPLETQCNNSEYTANFKAPSKFDYMKNAWDASSSANEDMQNILRDDCGKDNWYSEVLDLRRKASEYRHRAQNTHFCAGHMGQLLSDETQLWEHTASNRPATAGMDMRNIRPAGITYNRHYLQTPMAIQNHQLPPNFASEPQMTLEDVTNDADVNSVDSELEGVHANSAPALLETDVVPAAPPEENNGEASQQTEEDATEPHVGRIPTPELQEQHMIRHHLDRTTPTKGSLLITSPSMTTQKKIEAEYHPYTALEHANTVESHNYSAPDAGMKPKHCVQTCSLPSKNNCLPTFGKPSKDTHILRAQENSSNLPKTSFVQQSQMVSRDTNNVTLRSGNKRPKKSQVSSQSRPAGMKMNQKIPESMISTNTVPAGRKPNDKTHSGEDFLSQSLDSNNSLASEVLERTRKRLNFW